VQSCDFPFQPIRTPFTQSRIHVSRSNVLPSHCRFIRSCFSHYHRLSWRLRTPPRSSISESRCGFESGVTLACSARLLRSAQLLTARDNVGGLVCSLPRERALDLCNLGVVQRFDGSALLRLLGLDQVSIASVAGVSFLCGSQMDGSTHTLKGRTCRSETRCLPSRCLGTCPCCPNRR
jgi:hypothetical protein